MTLVRWAMKYFLPAWAAERLADVTLTWAILSLGGIEFNPLPAAFIDLFGLSKGLALFFAFTVGVGAILPLVIDKLLSCKKCMTSIDTAILKVIGGKDVYAKAVLYAALIVGFMPIIINGVTLMVILEISP